MAGPVRCRSTTPTTIRSLPYHRFAPQIYARHLYCLMMMLTETVGAGGYLHPTEEATLTPVERQELTAHRIAQWAINVVDFRDANAIMTPFEYDAYPFNANGWQPMDGNPATNEGVDRRLVWGAEYPDLLLAEAVAVHNRNVKDKEEDDAGEGLREPTGSTPPGDDDLDQFRIPQGSLFLELYCTRNLQRNPRYPTATNTSYPRELYDEFGNLDLGRLAPGGAPVWRVVITEPLNDESYASATPPESPQERFLGDLASSTPPTRPDSTALSLVPPNPGMGTTTSTFNMNLVSSIRDFSPLGVPLPAAVAADRIAAERFIWFANQNPGLSREGQATFYCRNFCARLGSETCPGRICSRRSAFDYTPGLGRRPHDPARPFGPRAMDRVIPLDRHAGQFVCHAQQ